MINASTTCQTLNRLQKVGRLDVKEAFEQHTHLVGVFTRCQCYKTPYFCNTDQRKRIVCSILIKIRKDREKYGNIQKKYEENIHFTEIPIFLALKKYINTDKISVFTEIRTYMKQIYCCLHFLFDCFYVRPSVFCSLFKVIGRFNHDIA